MKEVPCESGYVVRKGWSLGTYRSHLHSDFRGDIIYGFVHTAFELSSDHLQLKPGDTREEIQLLVGRDSLAEVIQGSLDLEEEDIKDMLQEMMTTKQRNTLWRLNFNMDERSLIEEKNRNKKMLQK